MENKNSFRYLKENYHEMGFGMVILGAGGKLQDWAEGIGAELIKQGIVTETNQAQYVFKQYYLLEGNIEGEDGRQDLVLIFSEKVKINGGVLAMWRLRFGDISWVDDFIVNYGKDYGDD